MLNLELIKDYLNANGFPTQWSTGRDPFLDDLTDNVDYHIGYSGISTIPDKGIPIGDLELIDEDSVQIFETKIICPQNKLHTSWNSLNSALKAFITLPENGQYSRINHIEGGVLGEGKRINHLDRWKILVNY